MRLRFETLGLFTTMKGENSNIDSPFLMYTGSNCLSIFQILAFVRHFMKIRSNGRCTLAANRSEWRNRSSSCKGVYERF